MTDIDLRQIRTRHQMIRFFDGYADERMEELDERKLRRPLVKTQLLELLNGLQTCTPEGLQAIFSRHGVNLTTVDDGLCLVTDPEMGPIGFLEQLRPRVIALYSICMSQDFARWVRNLVGFSPELDYVWLSGLAFNVLWGTVAQLSNPNRFTRLVFTHDSIFDIDRETIIREEEEEMTESGSEDETDKEDTIIIKERRETKFTLIDRVNVIQEKLDKLQELYSPLYAISQMRFPSPVGRGGHDFYDNGRVTNRSESFRDHRSHLLFVVRIYEHLLNATEQNAWYSIQESVETPGQFRKIVGAPLVIRFQETLDQRIFDHWITATFNRKNNRFRLWGHPMRLGPTKVHIYGVDRHLWHPLFLELTSKGCTAIIPNGTCGNTVHRLVTNIQRYLDPGAEAFIGEISYQELVRKSIHEIPYALDT